MFTHLITLKKAPWFIYSNNQEDALSICKKYGDNIVGVVLAPEGLVMQEVQTQITLVTPEIKLLEQIVESENINIAKEILEEECSLAEKEENHNHKSLTHHQSKETHQTE